MQSVGVSPASFTFPSVLGAADIEAGRNAHELITQMGFNSNLYIGNSLINMYARLCSFEEARNVFDGMTKRDIVSWNSMIAGYSANAEWEEAVSGYDELRMANIVPDYFTVEGVLPAFGALGVVDDGRSIHGLVIKIGVGDDRFVSNGLIVMYSRVERLSDARRVFDMMVRVDVVSWNAMINGCYLFGAFGEALELFREMVTRLKPDLVTITVVLRVCCDMEDWRMGGSVHAYGVRNGSKFDISALNTLIAVYVKCQSMHKARNVFDQMDCRDSVSWNSLIGGYISWKSFFDGAEVFKLMRESDVKPDSVTTIVFLSICTQLLYVRQGMSVHGDAIKRGFDSYVFVSNALLNMYSKCGRLDDGLKEFEEMGNRDIISWNTIISGCIHNGNCGLGFGLLRKMMVTGVELDVATVLAILPACSFLAAKRYGKETHGSILKSGLECCVPIGNALIEIYSQCGSLDYTVRAFEFMKNKDVVTWTALISAYGMYGQGEKALKTFENMEETGVKPDHVAFIAVLYACSHAGRVEEGKAIFMRMDKDYKVVPRMEHYACMVDLL